MMTGRGVGAAAALVAILAAGVAAAAPAAPGSCVEGACHLKFRKELAKRRLVHEVVKDGECVSCHEPHANGRPGKLRAPLAAACFSCHDGLGARVAKAARVHDPVARNRCAACHDPHGSDGARLLTAPPGSGAVPGGPRAAPCWACHRRELATAAGTTPATGFRNGGRNLHAVHLSRIGEPSCGACHDPHAGGPEGLVRTGKGAPKLIRTPAGGSCAEGCHAPRSYDRIRPVR